MHKFGYGDKFIHMIKVAYTNIESKIKINDLLSDPLIPMFVRQECVLSMLLHNAIKELKETGDHKIKIVRFTNNTIIFLRDITCLNRI